MEDLSNVKQEEFIQLEEVPGPDPTCDRRDHETVTVFNRKVVESINQCLGILSFESM